MPGWGAHGAQNQEPRSHSRFQVRRGRGSGADRVLFVVATAIVISTGMATAGCGLDVNGPGLEIAGDAALTARPSPPSDLLEPGRHPLALSGQRDGFLYVPSGLDSSSPAPLLVLLHGAGGDADNWAGAFALADSLGIVFLAIDSRGRTWDILAFGLYGPDVAFLDAALGKTFNHVAVDPARVGLAGFSDGASYALSIGLANGDLFTHILAWSPGFSAPARRQGSPQVFISHGSGDAILSVQNTRGSIVPSLESGGYVVHYEEFVGGHEIPAEIARQALDFFLGT